MSLLLTLLRRHGDHHHDDGGDMSGDDSVDKAMFLSIYNENLIYSNKGAGGMLACVGLLLLFQVIAKTLTSRSKWFLNNTDNFFSRLIKRSLILPGLFGAIHGTPINFFGFPLTIPARLYLVMYAGPLALIIGYFCAQYYGTEGVNTYRVLLQRSGVFGVALFPLLFLFASRNNPFIWLTGWSQATFMGLHKWASRLLLLVAAVHTAASKIAPDDTSSYHDDMAGYWYNAGLVSLSIVVIQVFFAMRLFRDYLYQFFWVWHLILALFAFSAVFVHVEATPGNYQYWMVAAIAIWAIDRVIRAAKMLMSAPASVNCDFVEAANVIKMKLNHSGTWKVGSGKHAFFNFLLGWRFYQSHPYSLYEMPGGEVRMTCRAEKGISLAIKRKLLEGQSNIKVCVDGPYPGTSTNFMLYDNRIYIATGIGITGILGHILQEHALENSGCRLVWIVRNESLISAFFEELDVLNQIGVSIDLFVTGTNLDETQTGDQKKNELIAEQRASFFSKTYSRPTLPLLLRQLLYSVKGSSAVVVCSRSEVSDQLRSVVCDSVMAFPWRLDYFEESFVF